MKRSLFLSTGTGLVLAPGAASAYQLIRPRRMDTLVANSGFYATLNGKQYLIYTRATYTDKVVFSIPGHGYFTYTTGCDVSNVFGYNCTPTAFKSPSNPDTGTVSYVPSTDTTTVHFPVPKFEPSYVGHGNGGGGKGGPITLGGRAKPLASGEAVYHSVEFAIATGGMIFAIVLFEATPAGWAATGFAAAAYGCAGYDLWFTQ